MEPTMTKPVVVLKFCGSSVARARRWRNIADLITRELAAGRRPVIVCSAVAGVTDALEALAEALTTAAQTATAIDVAPALDHLVAVHARLGAALGVDAATPLADEHHELAELCRRTIADRAPFGHAERASLLAVGERLSTRLGAAWLASRGLDAAWVDARDLLRALPEGPDTDDAVRFLSARCSAVPDPDLVRRLSHGASVLVTQGFVARDDAGRTVVLGRGGSDTSAAYLAAILGAVELQIWTDVPGLFTADPRRASGSRLLRRTTYAEAETLGGLGATVLHPRCLAPVRVAGVPVRIGWTERPEVDGTVIGGPDTDALPGIKAVSCRNGLHLVRVQRDPEWQPVGFMARVASVFSAHGLSMDLIASAPGEIRATLDAAAFPGLDARLDALLADLASLGEVTTRAGVACVSLVGSAISHEMDRIGSVLHLLGHPALHLVSHAADDSHLSYVVDAAVAGDLIAAMHETLFEMRARSAELGPTWRELNAPRRRPTSPGTTALGA